MSASLVPRVLVAVLLAVFALGQVHNTVAPLGIGTIVNGPPIYAAGLLATLLVALRGAAARGPARRGWSLLALGLLCWWLGDLYWLLAGEEEVPVPSWGDAGYLAFIPLALAGLGALAAAQLRAAPRALWIDAVVAALAAAATSAALVFGRIAAEGSALEVVTNLAYPVGDLALLAVVVGVLALRGWRLERRWLLLGLAVLVFWGTDSMYLVTAAADTYETGLWFDLGWFLATVLVAAAAWSGAADEAGAATTAPGDLRLTVMPMLFAVVSLALLVTAGWGHASVPAVALAGLSLAVVLVRLADANRLNARLLDASRAEARTDALTGLGNRRALVDDLAGRAAAARPDRPVHLALFDLDGFKHYNDTFGHPAGDRLLARLAAALERAVAGSGRAYRMGGDEFCVLLTGPRWSAAVAAATAALTERGDGFAIAASHGVVALPAEAGDAAAALHLVDQRMYLAKRGGRRPASRQTADALLRALVERSPALHEHTGHVAELADAVAARMGVGESERAAVRHAAELHDVGKVGIPDAVLHKPGPLDEAEWAFMRQHTLIGERIVSSAPDLAPVAPLVRASHERWDGGGYPDGLAGEAIPLGARIVAVCDAYDAMVAERPYRAARTPAQALAELEACAGAQFDPAVVAAFTAVCRASPAAAGLPLAA